MEEEALAARLADAGAVVETTWRGATMRFGRQAGWPEGRAVRVIGADGWGRCVGFLVAGDDPARWEAMRDGQSRMLPLAAAVDWLLDGHADS